MGRWLEAKCRSRNIRLYGSVLDAPIQRGGLVVLNLLANVKQKTIEPFIKDTIDQGTRVYMDAYSMYARLCAWGYDHKSVTHG